MAPTVLCLRPEDDFARVEALPPPGLDVLYRAPDDPALGDLVKKAIALVIPAVGPKLPRRFSKVPRCDSSRSPALASIALIAPR